MKKIIYVKNRPFYGSVPNLSAWLACVPELMHGLFPNVANTIKEITFYPNILKNDWVS